MAKFLDTQGVSYYLGKLIDNAEQRLYLISPYLQLNNQLKIALEDRAKFRIDIIMIYGKVADLNPKDSEWLENIDDIKLLFHQDLHAKCYINEKEAIVTSMNLYMYSQQNNVEMGIYVSKADDEELYKQILNEADKIKRGSEHRTISVQKVSDKESPKRKKEKSSTESNTNSKLLTTKELSQLTGLSSRKVNSWLTDEKLMYKKDDDWVTTKRGKEVGGIEKSGQYGQFIIWPEEIGKQMVE
ncbi:phospholipase D family protein [Gillisia limnaea]|uniref:Phospholipase D-like domain-containing protein n=1 Tax=Gillisia limnaea (strain DSM 15749 / LMG 21470 / R-8282) TaxID=865937 RepID=H2BXK9_GILLR|nr:phospholipase D family protein [Gillisia limnaea]EHQ03133.1 hypothetical protein Gilli_2509 [Gillisia limnaea DSM 15749]